MYLVLLKSNQVPGSLKKILFWFFGFVAVLFHWLEASQNLVFDPAVMSHLAQLRAPSIHDLSTKLLKASPSSLTCAPKTLLIQVT